MRPSRSVRIITDSLASSEPTALASSLMVPVRTAPTLTGTPFAAPLADAAASLAAMEEVVECFQ